MNESRNSIEDIWGSRTPFYGEWQERIDESITEIMAQTKLQQSWLMSRLKQSASQVLIATIK